MPDVTFDAVSTSNFESDSDTFEHVTGDNPNRILVVTVAQENSQQVTGVTYGGVALTELTAFSQGIDASLWVGFLIGPPVGAANVIVTLGASRSCWAAANTYYNVRQSNPVTGAQTNSGVGTSYSMTVPSADSESLVIDTWAAHSDAGLTPGANQTKRHDGASPGIGGSHCRGAGTDEPGDGGNITMSGSGFDDDDHLEWAGNLNASKVANNQVIQM